MVAHDEAEEAEDDDEEGGVEADFEGVLHTDVSDSLIPMLGPWYGTGVRTGVVTRGLVSGVNETDWCMLIH